MLLALSLLLVFVCRLNGVFFNLCVFFNHVFFGMSPHDKTFLCFWGKCRYLLNMFIQKYCHGSSKVSNKQIGIQIELANKGHKGIYLGE